MTTMNEQDIRDRAKKWATEALKFDEPMHSMILANIDEMSLQLEDMLYCKACESVLCGACGDCHGWDLDMGMPECPGDNDNMGRDCVAWWQAHKSVYQEVRSERLGW